MKKLSFLIAFTLLFTQIYGQKNDTVTSNKKLSYKHFIIPAALIASGSLLLGSRLNTDLQERSRVIVGDNFHSAADDVFPLVPIVHIYAGKYLGFQPENTILHQTIDIAVANTLTLAIVTTTKHIVKEERPDQSDNLSFPSGHTAIAFTNAALLFHEYRESNFWYASSGFLFATATGIFRVANNRHYASDVLAGAGIGLASGILVSSYNPFQSIRFGKNKKTTAFIYPQIGNQIGIGLLVRSK
ncbi:phosphatase PAP2 family protein [Flavobacterium sp. W22_SRS_FP1]|uniref:phosphatase PAP2 family protein n=1 Tax=Flavobacterium sp. W22_SRS_FP1 TaxID=3240276 RepID=UPI003F9125A0